MKVLRMPLSSQTDSLAHSRHSSALDWLRAISAVLVVALHAGIAYLSHPMPGLAWPTQDGQSSIVNGIVWTIELFIMPLFLIIAGYLAWQSLRRRGPADLVRTRVSRLLKPFAFACLFILPIDFYIWVDGWVIDGLVPARKLRSLKFEDGIDKNLWGFAHLWFLPYLMSYVALLAGVDTINRRGYRFGNFAQAFGQWSWQRWTAILMFTATAILYVRPEVVWGFQHAFLPVPSKWTYSGLFFIAGVLIAKHDRDFMSLAHACQRTIPLACVTAFAAIVMGLWHLDQSSLVTEKSSSSDASTTLAALLLAGLTVAAAITLSLAAIGATTRWNRSTPRWIAYLSGASFWIYLVHHPLVGLLQIDLKYLLPTAPAEIKFALVTILTTGISIGSYHVMIRQTRLGRWIGLASPSTSETSTTDQTDQPQILSLPSVDPEPSEKSSEQPSRRAA
jgi:glucans biosynthesis protein C